MSAARKAVGRAIDDAADALYDVEDHGFERVDSALASRVFYDVDATISRRANDIVTAARAKVTEAAEQLRDLAMELYR